MRLIRETNYDFMSKRYVAFIFSLAIIVPGIISMVVRGGLNLGVDFTGGTQVEVQILSNSGGVAPDVSIETVRQAVGAAGYDNRAIQKAGGGEVNDFLIHVQGGGKGTPGASDETAGRHVSETIIAQLNKSFPDLKVELRQVQAVGPKVGRELKAAALQAVLASILLVLIYVALRFEFRFGVATIVAATHDVLFVLGLFSLLNKEMTLTVIAAFLTLVGYSVNDTIVVFDRIREELKLRQKRDPYETIFNGAINKTLSRTLLTGVTTLLVLLSLFFAGGEVVHDFAWVLLVGIVVGTYSSIFVASPMLVEWQKRSDLRAGAKAATARATA
jgi:preprotein translocase subunit SecF